MLLVFGVPFAFGVLALWDWKPTVAVAVVGATVAGILAGAIVLVRRREADSWRNAFVALLALLAVTAFGLALFIVFTDAVLEAVL